MRRRPKLAAGYASFFSAFWRRCDLCGSEVALERMFTNRLSSVHPAMISWPRPPGADPTVLVCGYCVRVAGSPRAAIKEAIRVRLDDPQRISPAQWVDTEDDPPAK